MEVMSQSSDMRLRSALGSLDPQSKKAIESFKVNGVYYQEFQIEDPGSKGRMLPRVGKDLPSQPPYTTWSGLMRCSPNSPLAVRLMEKCGGVAIGEDEKEFTKADAEKVAAQEAKKKEEVKKEEVNKQEAKKEDKTAEQKKAEKEAEKKNADLANWWKSVNAEADKNKETEAKKEKARWWRSATAVIGYWTAPEDWTEMVAGNEPPTLCSTKDYPRQSFHPNWT